MRADYYRSHIGFVQNGCYLSQTGKSVSIPWDADEMLERTKLYETELHISPPETTYTTGISFLAGDCLEAAFALQRETGGKTAVLNLANRQNPGGGVYTGSGAQEESLFLRSNYYASLYPYAAYANDYDLPQAEQQYPLDRNFGGVWSEGVTVFRGRELEGYPLLDEPWQTNFIAVPALNHPKTVTVNGEQRLPPELEKAALNKIRTVLNIAAEHGVTDLVLGAMGCGAFHNPPRHIAELFRQALDEAPYKGRFRRVVFAITDPDLCGIFADVFGGRVEEP